MYVDGSVGSGPCQQSFTQQHCLPLCYRGATRGGAKNRGAEGISHIYIYASPLQFMHLGGYIPCASLCSVLFLAKNWGGCWGVQLPRNGVPTGLRIRPRNGTTNRTEHQNLLCSGLSVFALCFVQFIFSPCAHLVVLFPDGWPKHGPTLICPGCQASARHSLAQPRHR